MNPRVRWSTGGLYHKAAKIEHCFTSRAHRESWRTWGVLRLSMRTLTRCKLQARSGSKDWRKSRHTACHQAERLQGQALLHQVSRQTAPPTLKHQIAQVFIHSSTPAIERMNPQALSSSAQVSSAGAPQGSVAHKLKRWSTQALGRSPKQTATTVWWCD